MIAEVSLMGGSAQATAVTNGYHSNAPVFVVGCPRSGTTLLYHILLSAGNFTLYRAESNVFNMIVPRFGNLSAPGNRKKLLRKWLKSSLFSRSGLNADEISARIMGECRNGGDFLRIVMETIARQQGVERWAECTPDHVLDMLEIKRQIPNALIIHIIRDGRDVALSYAKQGWAHPLPWDRGQTLAVAALNWDWMVRKGRELGKRVGADYHEIFFEDLVNNPRETLSRLSPFVGQDLDLDCIRKSGIGCVTQPNSSFLSEKCNPVGRWKDKLESKQTASLEGLVGGLLQELGYPLSQGGMAAPTLQLRRMRATYMAMFAAKLWLKVNTPARYFTDLTRMGIRVD
jgi:hypothetical protein